MLFNELSESIDLNGIWQFALGQRETWGEMPVPGCWESDPSHSKFVDGPAYYRRSIAIPAGWNGRRILLECGAVSYACRVLLNGVEVGQHLGLWTPFTIALTAAACPGQENLLELEIYKPGQRYPTRASLAGFLPDVATTFGGIWQPLCLKAVTGALVDVQVQPACQPRQVRVQARAEVDPASLLRPTWKVSVFDDCCLIGEDRLPCVPGEPLDLTLALPDAQLWSPDSPNLYQVQIDLLSAETPLVRVTRRTGFRQLTTQGDQLLLNGQPCLVRGILSWGWEPERVAPTYTVEQARAELRAARGMGFNLVKLCLVVPSPAYFEVADEEGMLLWEELPMWLPEVNEQLRAQAPREYADIARLLAHHPSVALYSLGCELNQSVDGALMEQMNQAVRASVQDVLVCDNSGSGESYGGLDFDFADFTDYHPYYDLHYFEPLLDNWRRDWQRPRPWIFGEFCDSDTFRDLSEIIQASGGSRPWWLTRANPVSAWRGEAQAVLDWEARLAAADPGFSLAEIRAASYQQSFAIRKYTLEALRRRRAMGGYIITGLRDTPISTSGVWDDFGRAKWPPEQFVKINGQAILMLDVVRRRVWRHGGDRPDRLDPYNFEAGEAVRWYVLLHDTSAAWQPGSRLSWSLHGPRGELLASGESELTQPVQPGIPQQVGTISLRLPEVTRAAQLRLEVQLISETVREDEEEDESAETDAPPLTGTWRSVVNDWPVWVYPTLGEPPDGLALYDPTGVLGDFSDWFQPLAHISSDTALSGARWLVATSLTPPIWAAIAGGLRVLLLQQGERPLPARRCPFWREGIKLFPEHPLWQHFPQQGFSDLQFFGLASDLAFDTPRLAQALPEGAAIRPVLRRLDAREFHIADYILDVAFGRGRLLACSLRLQGGLGAQPTGKRNIAGMGMLGALLACLQD